METASGSGGSSGGASGGTAGNGGVGSIEATAGNAGASGVDGYDWCSFAVGGIGVGCPGYLPPANDRDAALPATDESEADAATAEPPTVWECDALARQAIDSFYEEHGDLWKLGVTRSDAGGPKVSSGSCSSDVFTLALDYQSDDLRFSIRFGCEQLHGASAADLNAAGPEISLNRLPTRLEVPGCPLSFNALPPVSSVDDAVEIIAIEDTRIVLRVRTRLFAVDARNRDEDACPYIADAGSPEQCWEQRRQDIMLDATFDLPFDGAVFEPLP